MTDYITILAENQNSIKSSAIYNLLIFNIAAKYVCRENREQFLIQRTTNASSNNETEQAARSYLDCYSQVVKSSKNPSCFEKFNKVFYCLESKGQIDSFPVNCVGNMEDFIDCAIKH